MDERLEKAIQTANYMATLNTQKKLAYEEFNQNLIYYYNGSGFTATRELINFVKTLIDSEYNQFVLLDDNNNPIEITDGKELLNSLLGVYIQATNRYVATYNSLKKKRRIEDLVEL